MKSIDIKNRIDALLYPELDGLLENIENNEIEYFIEHMVLDIQRSIHNWKLKNL